MAQSRTCCMGLDVHPASIAVTDGANERHAESSPPVPSDKRQSRCGVILDSMTKPFRSPINATSHLPKLRVRR